MNLDRRQFYIKPRVQELDSRVRGSTRRFFYHLVVLHSKRETSYHMVTDASCFACGDGKKMYQIGQDISQWDPDVGHIKGLVEWCSAAYTNRQVQIGLF